MTGTDKKIQKTLLIDELVRLTREITSLSKIRETTAIELAKLNCPFKVGDRVKKTVCDYGDKVCVSIFEIVRIAPGYYDYDYQLFACLVLHGGKLGKFEKELYPYYDKLEATDVNVKV